MISPAGAGAGTASTGPCGRDAGVPPSRSSLDQNGNKSEDSRLLSTSPYQDCLPAPVALGHSSLGSTPLRHAPLALTTASAAAATCRGGASHGGRVHPPPAPHNLYTTPWHIPQPRVHARRQQHHQHHLWNQPPGLLAAAVAAAAARATVPTLSPPPAPTPATAAGWAHPLNLSQLSVSPPPSAPGYSSQPLLASTGQLELSAHHLDLAVAAAAAAAAAQSPFLPPAAAAGGGMTGGFLPPMLDRFPVPPSSSPAGIQNTQPLLSLGGSSSFQRHLPASRPSSLQLPATAASQSQDQHKRKRSPSPELTRCSLGGGISNIGSSSLSSPIPTSPSPSALLNRSLKARILCRSDTTDVTDLPGQQHTEVPLSQSQNGKDLTLSTTVASTGGGTDDGFGGGEGKYTGQSNSHAATESSNITTTYPAASSHQPRPSPQPGHPAHFNRGSLIQLADGSMKVVEELLTADFLQSAAASPDVRIDQSTVVKLEPVVVVAPPTTTDNTISNNSNNNHSVLITFSVGQARVQVRVEAALEHPFYVFHQGWASYSPELTYCRYQLQCRPLRVGDVCISLTHKVPPATTTTAAADSASLLMPPPAVLEETSPTPLSPALRGVSSSSSSPGAGNNSDSCKPTGTGSGRQVGFHVVPSAYRIKTDSPPNQRTDPNEQKMESAKAEDCLVAESDDDYHDVATDLSVRPTAISGERTASPNPSEHPTPPQLPSSSPPISNQSCESTASLIIPLAKAPDDKNSKSDRHRTRNNTPSPLKRHRTNSNCSSGNSSCTNNIPSTKTAAGVKITMTNERTSPLSSSSGRSRNGDTSRTEIGPGQQLGSSSCIKPHPEVGDHSREFSPPPPPRKVGRMESDKDDLAPTTSTSDWAS